MPTTAPVTATDIQGVTTLADIRGENRMWWIESCTITEIINNIGINGGSGLGPGAIVGIVIVLLVVLVMGVAVAMVVALFLVRRRKTGPGGKHSTARNDIGLGKHLHEIVQALHAHDFLFIMIVITPRARMRSRG